MPDLKIKCPECEKILTISEFVEDNALVCRGCGAKLARPERSLNAKPKPRLSSVAKGEIVEAEESNDGDQKQTNTVWTGKKTLSKAEMRARVVHHRYAWVLFVVLGGAMAYLRYGGGLPPQMMAREKAYAMYGVLVLHACVVLKAFEDSVFQGILCLLVPFYSVYYLACVSDSVYLRALIVSVAIGIGQDGGESLQREFFKICKAVTEWIGSGGGPV